MNAYEGFVDLRAEAHQRAADDTVWPSFTDIMTVVVMIFLMALVVILLRNVELVQQLRATMDAERMATEIARATEEQKVSLASRVGNLEEQVSELRLQLLKAEDQQRETYSRLTDRQRELTETQAQRDRLRIEQQQLVVSRELLQTDLSTLQRSETALTAEKKQLQEKLLAKIKDLGLLQQAYSEQENELTQLHQEQAGEQQRILSLQGEYVQLKKKYDRLIRPARTPVGKYVVEVRIRKVTGKISIELREPGETIYSIVSKTALETRLAALKSEKTNRLYTRIVIPTDSGLSYSEAWTFTNDILTNYDYYYR